MRTIYFMRHGETDMNRAERMQGHTDCPLNDTGRAQAKKAAEALAALGLKFDAVYSSPLSRAAETAAIVSGFAPENIHYDARLIEMSFGGYEGRHFREIPQEVWRFLADPDAPQAAEIEIEEDLMDRTGSFLADLRENAPEGNTLVTLHGGAMRGLFGHLIGDGVRVYRKRDYFIGNCAVFRAQLTESGYTEFEEVLNLFRPAPKEDK